MTRKGKRAQHPPAPPTNLPVPLTRFVGRHQELAAVKQALASARLLSLIGPGGCGKTRLALQVAADLADTFADGVAWVELDSVADPALVPQAVAAALGLRESASEPLHDTLARYLKPRRSLLVLDNCEHLRSACAHLAGQLSAAAPNLTILTTSREPLGILGEVTWLVPSLGTPERDERWDPDTGLARLEQYDAVRLFVERAAAIQPGFGLTADSAASVVQICQRLEGMPLALELAAARVRTLSVTQIASRLDQMFQLLTRGYADLLPRHQTLRAAIDWSYVLLTDAEQTLLRRLAVFVGGFDLEAAEAVCADDALARERVLDLLSALVEKSLVQVSNRQASQARFRLLETVRQYAWEKLHESGEEAALRDRQRDWFLALAEAVNAHWRGPNQQALFDQLEREHDNLRTALVWSTSQPGGAESALRLCVSLWRFWDVHAHAQEGRRRLSEVLALPAAAKYPALRAQALHAAGHLTIFMREPEAAHALLEESLALARELHDQQLIANATFSLGVAARLRGEVEDAGRLLEASLAAFRDLGDRVGTYSALYNLAETARMTGADERALSLHEESLALKRAQGDPWSIANSLWSLALLSLHRGDRQRARAYLEESLSLFRALSDWRNCALCLDTIAMLLAGEQKSGLAARLLSAVDVQRGQYDYPHSAKGFPEYEPHMTATRAHLGEQRFAAHWKGGRALTLEEAVDEALHALHVPGTVAIPATAKALGLSEREWQVAQRIAQGKSNREIADELVLGVRTVETHVSGLLNKLGFSRRAQVRQWVIERGLATDERLDSA